MVIYLFLVFVLRRLGKRVLAQLNPFDFVVLLTLSNTVQNAIIGNDTSLLGGAVGAAALLAVNAVLVRIYYRGPSMKHLFTADRDIPLTSVEFRLLAAILEAGGRVLSRDRLLDLVYGSDGLDILDRTIDVHVRRLRDKLGDDPNKPRYVATVRGVGYRAASAGPGGERR